MPPMLLCANFGIRSGPIVEIRAASRRIVHCAARKHVLNMSKRMTIKMTVHCVDVNQNEYVQWSNTNYTASFWSCAAPERRRAEKKLHHPRSLTVSLDIFQQYFTLQRAKPNRGGKVRARVSCTCSRNRLFSVPAWPSLPSKLGHLSPVCERQGRATGIVALARSAALVVDWNHPH